MCKQLVNVYVSHASFTVQSTYWQQDTTVRGNTNNVGVKLFVLDEKRVPKHRQSVKFLAFVTLLCTATRTSGILLHFTGNLLHVCPGIPMYLRSHKQIVSLSFFLFFFVPAFFHFFHK